MVGLDISSRLTGDNVHLVVHNGAPVVLMLHLRGLEYCLLHLFGDGQRHRALFGVNSGDYRQVDC